MEQVVHRIYREQTKAPRLELFTINLRVKQKY